MNVLAVADEVVESLWGSRPRRPPPALVVAAGDLPRDYLEHLAGTYDVPLVYVPGNHDPDWSGVRLSRAGLPLRAGLPVEQVSPAGVNVDGRVADVGGLRVAGLGGSIRYRPGPNQYTQAEQARRARRLVRRAHRLRRRDGRGVDVLLTHAPPLDCGDDLDGPHRGFAALHDVVAALEPTYLLHGHIHPFGRAMPDRRIGTTTVVNCVPRRSLEIEPRTA